MLLKIVKGWSAAWIACVGLFFSLLPAQGYNYRVTNDFDAGMGSFRQVMQDMNDNIRAGYDLAPVIDFSGTYTLRPNSLIKIEVPADIMDVVKIVINGNGSTIDGGNLYPLQSNTENVEINNLILLPDGQPDTP